MYVLEKVPKSEKRHLLQNVIFHLLLNKMLETHFRTLKLFAVKLMVFLRLEMKFSAKISSELKMAAPCFCRVSYGLYCTVYKPCKVKRA